MELGSKRNDGEEKTHLYDGLSSEVVSSGLVSVGLISILSQKN